MRRSVVLCRLLAVTMATGLPGQKAEVVDFADVIQALHPGASADESQQTVRHVADVLRSVAQIEAQSRPPVQGRRPRQTVVQTNGTLMVVSGEDSVVAMVDRIHRQLAGPERRFALECTVLSLPKKIADAHAVPNAPARVAEPVVGALMKAAVQAGCRVRNLPECTARPLRTFAMTESAEAGRQAPVIEGELMPLDDRQVFLAVRFRGSAAAGSSPAAGPERTFRLESGAGVWLALEPEAKGGDDAPATVIWLRLAAAAPVQDAAERPK
jgi:hypothetical protein